MTNDSRPVEERVTAIVVNWNGWRDTVGCVASLVRLNGPIPNIIVCDNGSTDGSIMAMRSWLERELADGEFDVAPVGQMEWSVRRESDGAMAQLALLALAANGGYAAGLNAGIRWAQAHKPTPWYWLLNNDLEALPDALRALLDAARQDRSIGICGSVLLNWDPPHSIQAIAGRYNRWLAVGCHFTASSTTKGAVDYDCDYPVGASLFVHESYLRRVGLPDDRYFLYYEEIDWAERGRRAGFRPAIALRSQVRHKEGASTGSQGGVRGKSMLSEKYGVLNRLRVTRRFWPASLPVVWASLFLVVAERLLHGEFGRAALVLRLMFSPAQWRD